VSIGVSSFLSVLYISQSSEIIFFLSCIIFSICFDRSDRSPLVKSLISLGNHSISIFSKIGKTFSLVKGFVCRDCFCASQNQFRFCFRFSIVFETPFPSLVLVAIAVPRVHNHFPTLEAQALVCVTISSKIVHLVAHLPVDIHTTFS
jgi:hypothetical protein